MEKQKNVIEKLASSLNRRDEAPNLELAKEIAKQNDNKAIEELIRNLDNKKVQNDCIKVLYEVGDLKPELIAGYYKEFLKLLDSKNNRLQWGGMTALNTIVPEKPEAIFLALPEILEAADKGSVITKDNAVSILIRFCSLKQYADKTFPLLMEQLIKSPVNQLPMYAERVLPVVNKNNNKRFVEVLKSRVGDIDKESKRKRVEKVIKKLS